MSRLLSFLSFMRIGLVRGWSWRCLFLSRGVCIVQFLFGCGIVLLIFLIKKHTWGLPHSVSAVRPMVVGLRGSGNIPSIQTFGKLKERGNDLPKRQMFVNVLGLIFVSNQFPNDGKPMFFGCCFSWAERVSGLCILGLVRVIWVNPWELVDIRLHSPTPPGCMFRTLSKIHARVLWISECGQTHSWMLLQNNNNDRGVEARTPPSRQPNPIPAIPPCVVRTPHLHGAPTTEETVKL